MHKNKILLVIFCSVSLLVFGAVPVSADYTVIDNQARTLTGDSAYRYKPLLPDFLNINSGDIINAPIEYDSGDSVLMDFFNDYYTNTYITLLVQGTHTDYYPLGVQNPSFVGEDKKWSLVFIKFPNKSIPYTMQFTYFDPLTYEDRTSHPMGISLSSAPYDHEICTFNYDYASKKFTVANVSRWSFSQPYMFTYVVDSSKLSKPVSWYPNYSRFGETVDFSVVPYVANGILPHYNWWIGKKRVVIGDNSDSVFPDTDINDGTSSGGGSGGGSSSSGGGSSSGGVSGQKPGIGGDGEDAEVVPGGTISYTIKIYFYYYVNGVKTPFNNGSENNPMYFATAQVRDGQVYPVSFANFNGYITEYKSYRFFVTANRTEFEVIWIPKSGSDGTTSSGGGSTSSGGSGSLNPDTGNTSSNSGLKPFDPDKNNSGYRPNTNDPWGGNIFEGLTKPSSIAPSPGAGSVPTVSNPFGGIKPPAVSDPFGNIKPPTVSNPFGGNIPSVSNPFYAGSVPTVDNPFLYSISQKRKKSFITWLFEDTFLSILI